jgi:6-phosphofructokinase 1
VLLYQKEIYSLVFPNVTITALRQEVNFMDNIRSIGVLTSGGDAPGMNAAIRAVVRTGIHMGFKVMGIRKGYNGLINGDIFEMSLRSVSDIVHRGGTILQTARCLQFKTEEGIQQGAAMARVFGIDSIVVIGGDGSFRGAKDLGAHGLKVMVFREQSIMILDARSIP